MRLKKGDKVQIITGKDRGKSGAIEMMQVKVLPNGKTRRRIIISGLNLVTRHRKGVSGKPGGRVEKAAPIDISNVMLVCSHCNMKTRVGYRFEDTKKVRFCKKCQKTIN